MTNIVIYEVIHERKLVQFRMDSKRKEEKCSFLMIYFGGNS